MNITSEHYLGHGIPEPIGLEYITSILKSRDFDFNYISQNEVEISSKKNIKISLFSASSSEWSKVLYLNQKAKRRGNITVIGGYHITSTFKLNEGLPFDYAVIGEGEDVIEDVILEISENQQTRNSGSTKYIIATRIENINRLPFPNRNIKFLKEYKIFDFMWPIATNQINTAIILGSRGCNNNCSFCASSSMWGTGIRVRNPHNIIEEIWQLKDIYQTNTLVFIDQAFGLNKEWTEELCNLMIKEKLNVNWYLQTNITIDQSLIPLMAEAGCTKIGFGVEGISADSIKRIKPVNRKSLHEINEVFEVCNLNGILTKAYLLLGYPWEANETIDQYLIWLPELLANSIKISFFTPFPGTQDWEKYRNQLITQDWKYFDTVQMPVVRNPNISVNEYLNIRKKLFHAFYTSKNFKKTSLDIINNYPKYQLSFKDFFEFLKEFEMIPEGMCFMDWLPNYAFSK